MGEGERESGAVDSILLCQSWPIDTVSDSRHSGKMSVTSDVGLPNIRDTETEGLHLYAN